MIALSVAAAMLLSASGQQRQPARVNTDAQRAVETGFLNRSITVGAELFRYQVYVPPDYSSQRSWPVILWLHQNSVQGIDGIRPTDFGLGQAVRNWSVVQTSSAEQWFPAIVVFPQARPDRLWDNAMQRQAVAALDAATREFHGDEDRVYLMGWSLGGIGAWWLAAREPGRFAALVVMSGPLGFLAPAWTPSQSDAALRENEYLKSDDPHSIIAGRLKEVPIWVFQGAPDQTAPVEYARRTVAALKVKNPAVKYTEYEDASHTATPSRALASADLWAWLFTQRRRR